MRRKLVYVTRAYAILIRPSTLEFPDHVSTVDSGEVCDDGNNFSHDGCSPICVPEVY